LEKIYLQIFFIFLLTTYFVSYGCFSGLEFLALMDKVVFTREFVDFLIVFFSIIGCAMLILGIIMVKAQIGIIKRLADSIHDSGLY